MKCHFSLSIEHAFDFFANSIRWIVMPKIEIVPNENKYVPTSEDKPSDMNTSPENNNDQNPGWMASATKNSKKKTACSCLHESDNEQNTDGSNDPINRTASQTQHLVCEPTEAVAGAAKRKHSNEHDITPKRVKVVPESAQKENESKEIDLTEQMKKTQTTSNDADQVVTESNQTPQRPIILTNDEQVPKVRIVQYNNNQFHILQEDQAAHSNTDPAQSNSLLNTSTSDATLVVDQSFDAKQPTVAVLSFDAKQLTVADQISGAKQPMVTDQTSDVKQPTVQGMKFA